MSEDWPYHPAYITLRCDLVVNGVQVSIVQPASREVWESNPHLRTRIEADLRRALGMQIAEKLAPPVFEVRQDTLARDEARIDRTEALRLAEAHSKALADLCSRLEAAGENYAVMDARQAADAARALVAKLEGDEGRLPVRPGERRAP